MGRLADLVARDFGGPIVGLDNRLLTIASTAVQMILPLDADRVGGTIVNLSANKLYVGPFRNVASTKGFLLAPNGGQLVLDYRDDFLLVGLEWYCIASKANSRVYTQELIASS